MRSNAVKVMMGLFVAVVFGLAGCGGGGGTLSPTVSGTASEGALITGKTVKLKDANGKPAVDGTTNSTTGIYTIDVTGLTAPFLVTVTGTNGTYVSLAQTAGTANINPITTTVVALAVGNSDVSALFTNLKTSELTTISTNYAAKTALVTASLQAALPTGVKSEDYFTGTITAGKGMDAVFDTYQIAINTAGITVKTKDASATTVLTIPAATITANTTQALPTITAPTTPTPSFTLAVGSYTVASPNKGTLNVDTSGNVTITESGTIIGNGKLTATSTSTLFNFTASFTTDTDTLQGTLNTVTGQFSGTKNGSGSWTATKSTGGGAAAPTNFTSTVGSYLIASPNKGTLNVDTSGNVTITESGTIIGNGKLTATSTSTLFNFTASFTTDTDTLQGTLNTTTGKFSGTVNGSGSWSAQKQ